MLQNELKEQLKKLQFQNKIAFVFTGLFLLTTIVFGVLLFTNDNSKGSDTELFKSTEINQSPALQVANLQKDSVASILENLSDIEIIRKFDSMAYIIDTLELNLIRANAKASRDRSRYITASNYADAQTSTAVEQDNMAHLIENAKKYSNDCKKSLVFLYAAKKIAQIDGTSNANKRSINQMIKKCEASLFGSTQ